MDDQRAESPDVELDGPGEGEPTSESPGRMGWFYLLYLLFLPHAASFSTIQLLHPPESVQGFINLLGFFGGLVGLCIYAAIVIAYVPIPSSRFGLLFILLDGPIFVIGAALSGGAWQVMELFCWLFFIEGVSIYVAVAYLANISSSPTPGQRVASIILTLVAIAVTGLCFLPPIWEGLAGSWVHLAVFAGSLVESTVAIFLSIRTEKPIREGEDHTGLLVTVILSWIAVLVGGAIVRANDLL